MVGLMTRKGRGWHGEPGRHSMAARGISTVEKTPDTYYPPCPGFPGSTLENRLLSIGGKMVLLDPGDPDLDNILERGELLRDGRKTAFIQGRPGKCHANAAYLSEADEDMRVMTGYALSKDGVWRRHSWVIDTEDNIFIETTEPREKYYGFQMTKEESRRFAKENPGGFIYTWDEEDFHG